MGKRRPPGNAIKPVGDVSCCRILSHTQAAYEQYNDPSVVTFCKHVEYRYQNNLLNFALENTMGHPAKWFSVRLPSGETIAVAVVQFSEDAVLVSHIATREAYRRRGVATRLMAHIRFDVGPNKPMALTSRHEGGGIAFFESLGFEVCMTPEECVDHMIRCNPIFSMLGMDRATMVRKLEHGWCSEDALKVMSRGKVDSYRLFTLVAERCL